MTRERVVLVHGLWMGGWIMQPLRLRLRQGGYAPLTFSYPSYRATLDQNAERLRARLASLGAATVHLVGHSLGGLVILRCLAGQPEANAGRVVLLGSPVRDSYAARHLAVYEAGRRLVGPSLLEWIDRGATAATAGRQIGIIAGSRALGMGRLVAPGLPHPNDGVVAVAETRAAFARDHIVLPVSHSGMLLSKRVAQQVLHFLREGRFDHDQGSAG